MKYVNKNKKFIIFIILLCLSFNLYFIFLLSDIDIEYLLYLDFLIFIFFMFYFIIDYYFFSKKQKDRNELLQLPVIIYQELDIEDQEIIEHDIDILESQLQEQIDLNNDLQDYISKWCHEIKIPLSASLLINEKNEDKELKNSMKQQLERIKQQLNNVLIACKIQGNVYDFKINNVDLLDIVKTSLHNNQFFLIYHHFDIDIQVKHLIVYSDKEWMVYVLDQIINNAIKYRKNKPVLKIWSEEDHDHIQLVIEDNGEGIKEEDKGRVFEKGFTGSNHHNGSYKSTGMGLYIVKSIIEKLEHHIDIESEYDHYTRIVIIFQDHRDYFNMT